MSRTPKPAPFPIGTRLRHVGTLRISKEDGTPILNAGMGGTVVETNPGRRGTGRLIDLEDGDEPFRDETRDGYSVVETDTGFRRIARVDSWEPVA